MLEYSVLPNGLGQVRRDVKKDVRILNFIKDVTTKNTKDFISDVTTKNTKDFISDVTTKNTEDVRGRSLCDVNCQK